jgi:hypothetical protein
MEVCALNSILCILYICPTYSVLPRAIVHFTVWLVDSYVQKLSGKPRVDGILHTVESLVSGLRQI